MKVTMKAKTFATVIAVLLLSVSLVQTSYDGDKFTSYIGKSVDDPALKGLVGNYHCDIGDPNHCISKEGLEMHFRNGLLKEIVLYKSSNVYGAFKDKLPKSLKFDMTPEEVKAVMGKPLVMYSNGYSEYNSGGHNFSCWFEGRKLTQINISH